MPRKKKTPAAPAVPVCEACGGRPMRRVGSAANAGGVSTRYECRCGAAQIVRGPAPSTPADVISTR